MGEPWEADARRLVEWEIRAHGRRDVLGYALRALDEVDRLRTRLEDEHRKRQELSDAIDAMAIALGMGPLAHTHAVRDRVVELAPHMLRDEALQPTPTGGRGDVWQEVIAAIGPDHPAHALAVERRALGIERYGVPLQYDDGRDPWRDLREELLDAAAYAWRVGWYPLAWLLLWWAPWARRP